MSIFKDTFIPEVQRQLKARQNAILQRNKFQGNSTVIQYLNSRNAWVKMSSSVNIVTPGGDPNGTSDLAKSYILQGGILTPDNTLRRGVGDFNQAYSTKSPNQIDYQRGLRPMPGITSIDIKSKSAYGSLREVVVNFQCWDIKQLEDLELLYMRPNYSVLIEWGWLPYLKADDNGNPVGIETNIQYYDKLFKDTPSKETIWKELFEKSKTYQGNYDAMFGFVKNYSWSARPDGGYDCTTTLISIGEVLESLKVNYTPVNLDFSKNNGGLLYQNVPPSVLEKYKKNILSGLFAELFDKVKGLNSGFLDSENAEFGKTFRTQASLKTTDLEFFVKKLDTSSENSTNEDKTKLVGDNASTIQIYIKLKSLVNLLNEKIILSDSKNRTPIVKLSTQERVYDKPAGTKPKNLLCLSHPIQISVDPTICLIGNDLWANIKKSEDASSTTTAADIVRFTNTDYTNQLNEIKRLVDINDIGSESEDQLIRYVVNIIKGKNIEEYKEINRQCIAKFDVSFFSLLDRKLAEKTILSDILDFDKLTSTDTTQKKYFERLNAVSSIDPIRDEVEKLAELKEENREELGKAIKGSQYLKNLDSFFLDDKKELGIIGNIYINLQFLYGLSLNNNLESQDKKEKQEVALYDFIKNIMVQISNTTGNVNNFDIHVDPVDNIARIIDINYVNDKPKSEILKPDNIFELELHSLKSTVRSYKLESQIFPEQSTIVAIGAQVQGGALGTDSNTMSGFNRNIVDRVIPAKKDPNIATQIENESKQLEQEYSNLQENLKTIYKFFGHTSEENFWTTQAAYDVNSSGQYAGALRDLIKGFQSLTKDKNKYNAIIPTKLSVEMDGIGGLVIGHLFKIPQDLLPKGYKGNTNSEDVNSGIGSKIGYIITNIGHKIQSNDWTTNIEAQTIVLDDPIKGIEADYKIILDLASKSFEEGTTLTPEDVEIARNKALKYSNTTYQKAATYAKRMMKDLNLTDAQASGIFGNLIYESGGTLRPDVIESGKGYTVDDIPIGTDSVGIGWAQWTNSRGAKTGEGRMDKFLFPKGQRKPKSELTDDYNYNYLINEIKRDYKGVLNSIKSVSTVKASSDIFLLEFERPKDQGDAQKQRRAEIGNIVLEYIRNGSYISPSLKYPPIQPYVPPVLTAGGFIK